jgi:PPP family 3-phenylpropionic acid transporter
MGRMFGNPLIAYIADRRGDRKKPLIALGAASLATYASFAFTHGFWPLLGVSIIAGVALSAMMPLGENLALLTAYAEKLDYGRIRLWGSITFIAAATAGGRTRRLLCHGGDAYSWGRCGAGARAALGWRKT